MKNQVWFAQILSVALLCPFTVFAYSSGPDATTAGVPGETSCAACHGGGAGSGSVKVTFAGGNTYAPGVKQHFTVTVADSAQKRWGFELTARLSNNTTQAGSFTPGSDGYTQLVCADIKLQNESFGLKWTPSVGQKNGRP